MVNRTLAKSSRHRQVSKSTIPCCHGLVYTISNSALGIVAESSSEIVERLRLIEGVKVIEWRGRWCDMTCPPLRLPEITAVLIPLSSARARSISLAANLGRNWRTPLVHNVFWESEKVDWWPTESQAPAADCPSTGPVSLDPNPPEATYGNRLCAR